MRTKVYTIVSPDLDVYVCSSVIRVWIEHLQDMVLKGEKLSIVNIFTGENVPLRLKSLRAYLREHLIVSIYHNDKLMYKVEKHEI